jgi:Family of unknown function (DUF6263)
VGNLLLKQNTTKNRKLAGISAYQLKKSHKRNKVVETGHALSLLIFFVFFVSWWETQQNNIFFPHACNDCEEESSNLSIVFRVIGIPLTSFMKLNIFFISFLILFFSPTLFSQKIAGLLKFEQGEKLTINMKLKTTITQEAMGQAIDFTVDGAATHSYKVTNTTEDNTTLHHQLQKIAFNFDGMGQKRVFDSNNEKDMNGEFGKPIRELLGKSFDMIIDPNGKVMMVQPEKIENSKMDDRLAIITNMLKDLLDIVQPPQKGSPGFFKVLPENAVAINERWDESTENASGKSTTTYTLMAITDSTILVNFTGNSVTVTKAVMMGNETTTTMNNKTSGKIILDKKTGLLREKTTTIESNGSTDAMGGTLPVTSKTTVVIVVTSQ